MINWEDLNLPEYEDPAATKVRLDDIHKQILADKGIATKPSKNSPGFAPTPYQSRQVAVMSALGLDPKDIALVLDVEERLLTVYYKKELRVSHNLANAMVAQKALEMALSGRYPDMTKFWLKSRGGWKETLASTNEGGKGPDGDTTSAKDKLKALIGIKVTVTEEKSKP